MNNKLLEYSGMDVSFEVPETKKSVRIAAIVGLILFIGVLIVFPLIFFSIKLFPRYGWLSFLIVPLIFSARGIIMTLFSWTGVHQGDPHFRYYPVEPITESDAKILKREFSKQFYVYSSHEKSVALTKNYLVYPFKQKMDPTKTTFIKISDIVWAYEHERFSRGYTRVVFTVRSKRKQQIMIVDAKEYYNTFIRSFSNKIKSSKQFNLFRDMILEKTSKNVLLGKSDENEKKYCKIVGEKYVEPQTQAPETDDGPSVEEYDDEFNDEPEEF